MEQSFKIWPPYEVFYIQAMLFNTRSVLLSAVNLENLFEKSALDDPTKATEILNDLQNILLRAAALSKYFWPIRKKHEERGKYLREIFDMKDSNPLKDRSLRDAIEHFDERLDKFTSGNVVGQIYPELICFSPSDDGITKPFRAFYTDTATAEILGERYEIEPVVNEILRIHNHLYFCDINGGRLRPISQSPDKEAC